MKPTKTSRQLGVFFLEARSKSGISLSEAAKMTGYSEQLLSEVERGEALLPGKVLFRLITKYSPSPIELQQMLIELRCVS